MHPINLELIVSFKKKKLELIEYKQNKEKKQKNKYGGI